MNSAVPLEASVPFDAVQRRFEEEGFAILPGHFPPEVCDRIVSELERYVGPERHMIETRATVDVLHGAHMGRLVSVREAPDEAFTGPFKVNNLFTESEAISDAVFAPELQETLKRLLRAAPVAINPLNFKFGSQQPAHIDTWYMPPPEARSLVVASTCLEDVRPEAGPLFYYPGSHRIPPYVFSHGRLDAVAAEMTECRRYLERQIERRGLKQEAFIGKKGDVFLWTRSSSMEVTPSSNRP